MTESETPSLNNQSSNVSVIVVAYHSDQWLPACISSLKTATIKKPKLILVDNQGNNKIKEIDFSGIDVEIIKTPYGMGFADANNYAVENADILEDYILFLNQDTVSDTQWIDQCISAFNSDSAIGAVSPLIRNYDDTLWDPSFLDSVGSEPTKNFDKVTFIHTQRVPAPALIVKKDILKKVGLFDPIYGSYYEDYDLCRRIEASGYKVGFCTQARICHFSGSTTDSVIKEKKRQSVILRNRVIYGARSRAGFNRTRFVLFHLTIGFVYRVGRSLANTPSSQFLGSVLKSWFSLWPILDRLFFEKADRLATKRDFDLIKFD